MSQDSLEKAQEALDNLLNCDPSALKELMRKHKIYRKGLFSFCSFKEGDRVIITGEIYENENHGAYARDPSLRKGAVGTVDSVDWREYKKKEGGYFCCMFKPDFESWIDTNKLQRQGWKNSGELGELGKQGLPENLTVDRHLYFISEKNLSSVPEGYDESTVVRCRSCGWKGGHHELERRPPEGFNHLRLWCPVESCGNYDGGYPDERGFDVLDCPALRWKEK